MIFTLKCPNGTEIDMSSYILLQMSGEITREVVKERIDFYMKTNV
jgi:hypothetical protein